MLDKNELNKAIYAKEILTNLDTSARDALLAESITKALTSYDFKNAVEDVVAKKAWADQIKTTIELGFEDYLKELRFALPKLLKEELHGSDTGTYSSKASRLLSVWPKS